MLEMGVFFILFLISSINILLVNQKGLLNGISVVKNKLLMGNSDWIVSRENVRILLKYINKDIHPVPNYTRHEWENGTPLFWFPILMFAEFQSCGLEFHEPLTDTNDGLRAFTLKDYDGYVVCFGKPF